MILSLNIFYNTLAFFHHISMIKRSLTFSVSVNNIFKCHMICSIWQTKRLTIKSLLCKIAFIDSNGYSPPSFCHDFGWKFTLLWFTTHCTLPVFLVVMCVQSSMKCTILYVQRSSGKFKLVQVWNWSWFFYDLSSAVFNVTLRWDFVFKLKLQTTFILGKPLCALCKPEWLVIVASDEYF